MSDENPTPKLVPPQPAPAKKIPLVGATLRSLLLTVEEKKKLDKLMRAIENDTYPTHDARKLAVRMCELYRMLFGEFQTKDKQAERNAQAAAMQIDQTKGVDQTRGSGLPHGAQRSYSEIQDKDGKVTHRVIDGKVFEINDDEQAALMHEHGETPEQGEEE